MQNKKFGSPQKLTGNQHARFNNKVAEMIISKRHFVKLRMQRFCRHYRDRIF